MIWAGHSQHKGLESRRCFAFFVPRSELARRRKLSGLHPTRKRRETALNQISIPWTSPFDQPSLPPQDRETRLVSPSHGSRFELPPAQTNGPADCDRITSELASLRAIPLELLDGPARLAAVCLVVARPTYIYRAFGRDPRLASSYVLWIEPWPEEASSGHNPRVALPEFVAHWNFYLGKYARGVLAPTNIGDHATDHDTGESAG